MVVQIVTGKLGAKLMSLRMRCGTKSFGNVVALNNASFVAEEGRITCLMGLNGVGKTTAIKAICGLVHLDKGDVLVDGSPLRQHHSPLSRIGLVLGPDHWVLSRSGYQNLRGLAMTNAVGQTRILECLDKVGLAQVANKQVSTYSLGMRQRLALAGALIGQPGNIILDEPFSGLDPHGMRWLHKLLRQIASDGHTVLLSSHLLTEIETLIDDVVLLNSGKVTGQFTLEDIQATEHGLESWFFRNTEKGSNFV